MNLKEPIERTADSQGRNVTAVQANRQDLSAIFDHDPLKYPAYTWKLVDGDDQEIIRGAGMTLREAIEDAYKAWLRHIRPVRVDTWDLPKLLPESTIDAIHQGVMGDDG